MTDDKPDVLIDGMEVCVVLSELDVAESDSVSIVCLVSENDDSVVELSAEHSSFHISDRKGSLPSSF